MREALDKLEGGICIVGRMVTNLRYADDTILIARSKEDTIEIMERKENKRESRPTPRLTFLTFLTFLDHLLVQGRPVFESSSIFGLVPCLQSVGISSCLPVCCPSISFSVGLGSFSQRPLVLAILHRCGWVLASSSGQTTLVFCFPGKFQQVLRGPPS